MTPRSVARLVVTGLIMGLVVGLIMGMFVSSSGPAFAKAAPKIQVDDACTFVTTKQVSKFGKPVGAPTPSSLKLDCKYAVGTDPAASPGGTFTSLILYPNPFAAFVENAQLGVEDQFAIDKLSGFDVEDVAGLGTSAYFNTTKGEVVFSPNKKLGVILNWAPAPAGTPVTKSDQKKLIALAKEVAKRANR